MILFCQCGWGSLLPEADSSRLLCGLKGSGLEYEAVNDLCLLAEQRDPRLEEWTKKGDLTIVACYPRAVRSIFEWSGIQFPDKVRFLNHREMNIDEIAEALGIRSLPESVSGEGSAGPREGEWPSWFPVIDRERCVNCGQCMSFCLFGVYSRDDSGKIEVTSPRSCKENCPACSRICPHVAIIFPKYTESPMNGAGIEDEKLEKQRVKLDMDEILGGDIYKALAERRKMRRKLLKDS